jgi:dienelactone hydrolase
MGIGNFGILCLMTDIEKLNEKVKYSKNQCDLDAELISREDSGNYWTEKVSFNVAENERINAYVLIPKTLENTAPAVYCFHQHGSNWDIGKSEPVGLMGDPDLAYAKELTELGYITITPDAFAFEERNQGGGAGETFFEMVKKIVMGDTLLAKVISDTVKGIDYILSRKECNGNIGFIGHSYGGRMALWLPVFDNRIKVSVSNCGCVNYEDSIDENRVGIQMEFGVPDILGFGDMDKITKLGCNTNLLISATKDDKYSTGAEVLYSRIKGSYIDSEVLLSKYEGGHIFTKEMRTNAYNFIAKHLPLQ